MRKSMIALGLFILIGSGWSRAGTGSADPAPTAPELRIRVRLLDYGSDGMLSKEQQFGIGAVGVQMEIGRIGQKVQGRFGRGLDDFDFDRSVLARTELKSDREILFHLEWREHGKVVRSENIVSRNLDPVTATLHVEPATGVRHAVQFSPQAADEKDSAFSPQRVDRMRLRPGGPAGPLLRDGKLLALMKGIEGGFERIYVNLPGTGFFQFSLQPFPGAQPAGRLEGAVISFERPEGKYQWFLGDAPLPAGTWTVFVKVTDQIPPEYRSAINPEFQNEIVVGGSNGAS